VTFLRIATLQHPLAAVHAEELLARLDQFYDEKPYVLWNHWPSPDLGTWGLDFMMHLRLMVRPPGAALPAPPPELRIVNATDSVTVAAWERVLSDGYPLPELQPAQAGILADKRTVEGQLRLWVGYVGNCPVTTAAVLPDGVVEGIYMVATVPEARHRGYGSAITACAVACAPTLPAVLQATEDGVAVYTRLGFLDVSRVALWLRQARPKQVSTRTQNQNIKPATEMPG